jgi:hypothetical protein
LVTRWKFTRTSPIDEEMRMTPGLAGCALAFRDG